MNAYYVRLYTPKRGSERKGWQDTFVVTAANGPDAEKILRATHPSAFADPTTTVKDVLPAPLATKISTWRC